MGCKHIWKYGWDLIFGYQHRDCLKCGIRQDEPNGY